jgi:hypothetical protein
VQLYKKEGETPNKAKLEAEIDDLVYQLYEITEDERKIIEKLADS